MKFLTKKDILLGYLRSRYSAELELLQESVSDEYQTILKTVHNDSSLFDYFSMSRGFLVNRRGALYRGS